MERARSLVSRIAIFSCKCRRSGRSSLRRQEGGADLPQGTSCSCLQGFREAGTSRGSSGTPDYQGPCSPRLLLGCVFSLSSFLFLPVFSFSPSVVPSTSTDPLSFTVTPFGRHFALMEASDLLLIDHDGKVVLGGKPDRQVYNTAAFIIHAKVHAERPNANAVCHSHSPYGKAFSVLRAPLFPFFLFLRRFTPSILAGKPLPYYTQDACVFYGEIGVYGNFGGVVLDMSESSRIAEALGPKNKALSASTSFLSPYISSSSAMLTRVTATVMVNHGLLTVGETIERSVRSFSLPPFSPILPDSVLNTLSEPQLTLHPHPQCDLLVYLGQSSLRLFPLLAHFTLFSSPAVTAH
jgi:ribulose-5-phosphate 4-epimerase/fuculose-1-phosphate aldolase